MRSWNSFARKFIRGVERVVFREEGDVRAVWKVLFAYALYVLWAYAAMYLLSYGFGELFEAWNLNARTMARAPGWAAWLAGNYGRIISLVSSLGTIGLALLLLKWFTGGRRTPIRWKPLGIGALCGLGTVALGTGLFLLLDSMRLYDKTLTLSWELAWLFFIYLLAAIAEEQFARTLMMKIAAKNAKPYLAYIASTAVFLAITGSYALAPLGIANMLLIGLLCARVSESGYAGASVGFRFAWSFFSNAVFCFPGSNTAQSPMLSLYSVSEAWLTGGENGIICGAWMTLLLAAVSIVLWTRDGKKLPWKRILKPKRKTRK